MSLFAGISAIGYLVDVVFGSEKFNDWIVSFLNSRIYINFLVAVLLVTYIMVREKIKKRKTEV
jgi:hypothetical protein